MPKYMHVIINIQQYKYKCINENHVIANGTILTWSPTGLITMTLRLIIDIYQDNNIIA